MRPGRKPKPPELRIIEGNPGKRRIPKTPRATGKPGQPPKHLDKRARAEYRRIVKDAPWAAACDGGVIELAATAYSQWRTAKEHIEAHGAAYTAPTGHVKASPWQTIANQSQSFYLKCLAELGLTPSSRVRVSSEDAEPSDELEAWQQGLT